MSDDGVVEQVIGTWHVHNQINLYLLERIPMPRSWGEWGYAPR